MAKLQSANQRQGELLAQIIKDLRQIVSRVIVVRRAAGEAAEDHRFLRRQHAAVQQLKQHALDAERVLVDILHHQDAVADRRQPRRADKRGQHRQISPPQGAFHPAVRPFARPFEGEFRLA